MARIRTIKPEFFTSEDIFGMTPLARLFYVSLWCESDREGRLEWKPGTFKARYLPADDCDINALGEELIGKGLIILYKANGKDYAEIPTFTEHQVINNRENKSIIPRRTPGADIENSDRLPSGVNLTPATRETVLARDGNKCVRCGAAEDLTVDHIFPQSLGGNHALKNLRCLCRSCNSARPVAGAGLIADLAMDNLTLSDMNDYCFHASPRVGTRESAVEAEGKEGREGKGREGKGREGEHHVPTQSADEVIAPKPAKRLPSPEDEALAARIFGLILDGNPAAKKPNLLAWADDIRLMREQDGRTLPEIWSMFQWVRRDTFWRPNVMCPSKLREKWDQLVEVRARPAGRGEPAVNEKFVFNHLDRSGDARAMAESMARHGITLPAADEDIEI